MGDFLSIGHVFANGHCEAGISKAYFFNGHAKTGGGAIIFPHRIGTSGCQCVWIGCHLCLSPRIYLLRHLAR